MTDHTPTDTRLGELWAEIHFSENSIPSIRAGKLTKKSKAEIKELFLELIEEADPSKGSGSKVYWGNVLRQKVEEL